VEHQPGTRLHRRPHPGSDERECLAERGRVPGPYPASESRGEGRHRPAVRDLVPGHDEVGGVEPSRHDLPEVHPGVGEAGHPQSAEHVELAPFRAVVRDAAVSLDATTPRGADHVQVLLTLQCGRKRKAPELSRSDVRERAVRREGQGEQGRTLVGRLRLGEGAHGLRLAPQPLQAPLVVAQPELPRRGQGQRTRRQGRELGWRHPQRVPESRNSAGASSTGGRRDASRTGNTRTSGTARCACCLLSTAVGSGWRVLDSRPVDMVGG